MRMWESGMPWVLIPSASLGLALGKLTFCLDFSTCKAKFLTHPYLLHKAVDDWFLECWEQQTSYHTVKSWQNSRQAGKQRSAFTTMNKRFAKGEPSWALGRVKQQQLSSKNPRQKWKTNKIAQNTKPLRKASLEKKEILKSFEPNKFILYCLRNWVRKPLCWQQLFLSAQILSDAICKRRGKKKRILEKKHSNSLPVSQLAENKLKSNRQYLFLKQYQINTIFLLLQGHRHYGQQRRCK